VIVLVHAAPATLARHRQPHLGVLSSPRRFYNDVDGWAWAADNDAYSNWNEDRYRRMLDAISRLDGCLFVTAPDVVSDWQATHALFETWQPQLAELGLPAGYVIQDGQPAERMPWERMRALFVGGSDEFKMGPVARALVAEASRQGLWTHMGRVNGHRRLRYAKAIGCDSFDGTSLSWFRDRWLQDFIDHAASPDVQLLLEEAPR
jgi:hypothetical protein